MKYQLEDINFRTVSDPAAFMAESDEAYRHKVEQAADLIAANRKRSPIVLLSGPSGSGKTTTSMKIAEELNRNLCDTNPQYGYKFEKGIFGRLDVKYVQPETYLLYRDLAISKGTASSQLKPPHILNNEMQRRFFLALLEEGQ